VPKFNKSEREYVKDIINLYSLKRFSTEEIIRGIYEATKHKVTPVYISQVRKRIREEAAKWYRSIRDGDYEYIYQFKERIDEILYLQRKHYEIVSSCGDNPSLVQTSLAELHRLNITLSNYYDVAPSIMVDNKTLSKQQELNIKNKLKQKKKLPYILDCLDSSSITDKGLRFLVLFKNMNEPIN
jgi:hypothetical protein